MHAMKRGLLPKSHPVLDRLSPHALTALISFGKLQSGDPLDTT